MSNISKVLAEKKNLWAEQVKAKYKCLHFAGDDVLPEDDEEFFSDYLKFHLSFLIEAIEENKPEIFINYVKWVNVTFQARNVPVLKLISGFENIDLAARDIFTEEIYLLVGFYINKGIKVLKTVPEGFETHLLPENPLFYEATEFLNLLLSGNRNEAQLLVNRLLDEKNTIISIYENIFKNCLYEIGLLWQTNKITVAHEHYFTAAVQSIMATMYPSIFATKRKGAKMLACTISVSLHEMGIRMMTDYFELDGWDTCYLGANVPNNSIIAAIKEQKPDILAISVAMAFQLSKAKTLISKIRAETELKNLKIIVGGYPFIQFPEMSVKIGADGTAKNGPEAVLLANNLLIEEYIR